VRKQKTMIGRMESRCLPEINYEIPFRSVVISRLAPDEPSLPFTWVTGYSSSLKHDAELNTDSVVI